MGSTLPVGFVPEVAKFRIMGLLGRASIAANTGEYEGAESMYHEALEKCGYRYPDLRSNTLLCLGDLDFDRSKYKTAERFYDRSMTHLQEIGLSDAQIIVAKGRFAKARISQDLGYPDHAESLASDAMGTFEAFQQHKLTAIGYNLLGLMAWQRGEVQKGRNYIEKSIRIKKKLGGMERGLAASYFLRAFMELDEKVDSLKECRRRGKAYDDVMDALCTYKDASDKLGLAKAHYVWGRLNESNDPSCGSISYQRVIEFGFPKGKAVALQGLARGSEGKTARKYHNEAVKIFKKLGCNPKHIPKTPNSLDRILETFA